mgnify:CR=1 FL=1
MDTKRHPVEDVILAPDGDPIDKGLVLRWEIAAFFVINVFAGVLHFVFELSDFAPWVAVFGSVNESTFEHLKLYFWPALVFALIQHAYARGKMNNFWWGKGLAMLVTPLALMLAFYFYLGIAIPLTGEGRLFFDIGSGVFGVLVGTVVSYRILTSPPKPKGYTTAGWVIIGVLALHMATAAWLYPEFFLYENFWGYEYSRQYGILEDYTPYLIFTGR